MFQIYMNNCWSSVTPNIVFIDFTLELLAMQLHIIQRIDLNITP